MVINFRRFSLAIEVKGFNKGIDHFGKIQKPSAITLN